MVFASCFAMGASAKETIPGNTAVNQNNMVGSTVYPSEGGVWTYGYNFLDVFSDYFHQTNSHKSSCMGIGGHIADSGWMPGGVTSVSSWGIDPLGNNHWYYDIR